MVAATCVYEGTASEVAAQEAKLNAIAAKFGGLSGGEKNGKYGYRLTFAIAYLRKAARDEIIACGGSISHHHGVGKLRKEWLPGTVGETGLLTLRAIKQKLDPTVRKVFASFSDF
ncbi:unnamed protein product [Gongylonema pulchrum]|uniref:Alkylglycerone-phosphate synthase n=1 Tax=Gongylonema pulchrum TaxID=637853 RepID=A0A183E7X5_9BILA|nr:unnamed protein product [Gongylonema pulchrum]